jgi:hypothetical protein
MMIVIPQFYQYQQNHQVLLIQTSSDIHSDGLSIMYCTGTDYPLCTVQWRLSIMYCTVTDYPLGIVQWRIIHYVLYSDGLSIRYCTVTDYPLGTVQWRIIH